MNREQVHYTLFGLSVKRRARMVRKKPNKWKQALAKWGLSWLADHIAEAIMFATLPAILAGFWSAVAWITSLPWSDVGYWIIVIIAARTILSAMTWSWKGMYELLHPSRPLRKRKRVVKSTRGAKAEK